MWKKIKKILLLSCILFFGSSLFFVVLYRFVNPPLTPLMAIRYTQHVFNGETPRLAKEWVAINKISSNMIRAVVASEDNLFMEHNGFDIEALRKANEYNKKKGGKIRGGSTISQQTAKNVFLWPKRSYLRKGLEAYFTVLIELVWSKERIMEVYLNVIEMGNGIYGIEKAAQTYFKKPAKDLSKSQAALIASILPAPRTRNPAKPTKYLEKRKNKIMYLMDRIGPISFR